MGEPQDIPRYANGQVVDYTWAESGAATEPTSGRKATGLAVGDVPAPDDWNWPDQTAARFARAMFSRHVNASEGLFTSWLVPGSGVWEDGVNPLEGYLGDGGGTNNLVADVWLNPEDIDEGAVRVQVTASKASPVTFTADRDNYVFVPVDLTTPPLATAGDLTITPVVIGNPAPATPAGTVGVWKVTTDATSIVSQEVLVFDLPAFKAIQLAEDLDVDGDLTVGGTIESTGTITAGNNLIATNNLTVLGTQILGPGAAGFITTAGAQYDVPFVFTDDVTLADVEVLGEIGGTSLAIAAPTTVSKPLVNYTHAATTDWRDCYRPQTRTLTTSGLVGAGGEVVNIPITSSVSGDADVLFHVDSILPTTHSATVAFDFDVLYTWGIAVVPIAGEANVLQSFRFTAVAKYEDGVWTETYDGTADEAGTASLSSVGTDIVSDEVVLATDHNIAVQGYGYRGVITVTARILEIADSV